MKHVKDLRCHEKLPTNLKATSRPLALDDGEIFTEVNVELVNA